MKRADFIQQEVLNLHSATMASTMTYDTMPLTPAERICRATELADAMEQSGKAPWDGDERDICGGSEHCPGCTGCIPSLRNNVQSEREACAQIAGRYGAHAGALDAVRAASEIAAEIRTRGAT